MSTRAKGARIQRLAIAWAKTFPNTHVIPLYQPSRFAKPQPFDLLVFRTDYLIRLVEVRSNQWRTGRLSTEHLAELPGEMYQKQIWLHQNGHHDFKVREWHDTKGWVSLTNPWEFN